MDRELLLGEATAAHRRTPGRRRRAGGAPDRAAPSGARTGDRARRPGRTSPAGVIAKMRRRRPSVSGLRDQAERRQSGRLAVQQRVRERPEVPERGADVLLQVVRRRRSLAGQQPEDEVRGRRSGARVDILRTVPYTTKYSALPTTDQLPGKSTPGGRPTRSSDLDSPRRRGRQHRWSTMTTATQKMIERIPLEVLNNDNSSSSTSSTRRTTSSTPPQPGVAPDARGFQADRDRAEEGLSRTSATRSTTWSRRRPDRASPDRQRHHEG